jgi:hypothetical protein
MTIFPQRIEGERFVVRVLVDRHAAHCAIDFSSFSFIHVRVQISAREKHSLVFLSLTQTHGTTMFFLPQRTVINFEPIEFDGWLVSITKVDTNFTLNYLFF